VTASAAQPASEAAAPTRRIRKSRLLAAILCGLVLGGATGSTTAWALSPQPTADDLGMVAMVLLPPSTVAGDVSTLSVDSVGLGPNEVRATIDPPLAITANADEPTDEGDVGDVFERARAAGFTDVLLERSQDRVAVVGKRDGLAFELQDAQLDIAPLVGWLVPAATVAGAAGFALLAGYRSVRRQADGRSRTVARLVTAGSWAVLPLMVVCTVALPFFLAPGASAADTGDYGSIVLGLVVLGFGLWLSIAAVVGLIAWVLFGRRLQPGPDGDVVF